MSVGTTLANSTSPVRSACHARGQYLCATQHTDESVHEASSVQANRTAQQLRTRACQILPPPRSIVPLELRNGQPRGHLNTTAFPLRSPQQPSDPMPRRGLALAGVPAPKDVPCSTSTSTSALYHRAWSVYGHGTKGQGRARSGGPVCGPANGTTPPATSFYTHSS